MIDVNPKTMMEFPQITYTLNLAVALFAVFVAPFAITALYKNVKNVHRNLKVISMAMAVCWMLQPLMTAAFLAVLLIKSEDVSITEAAKTPLGLTTRQIMTVASHSIKTLEVMLAMERVLATVYSKVYEKAKAWYFLGVFTVIFCVLLAILVNAMVNIFHVSFYITWAFLVSTDIFTFVSLVILSTYNRRLRLKSATTAVALSEKYQIIENITSIRLFIYSSSIWFIFSSTALVMSIVTDSYMAIGNPYYFGIINMYVVATAVYWNFQIPRGRQIFSVVYQKSGFFAVLFGSRRVCNGNTVETTMGQCVRTNLTSDEHMKALRDMWK